MQTLDRVSGFPNCLEFSHAPSSLDEATARSQMSIFSKKKLNLIEEGVPMYSKKITHF